MIDVESKDLVLVTGGTGYVAGWMIAGLLRNGYRVRTTLRDPGKQGAVKKAVEGAVGDTGNRLTFATADLLRDDGWTGAADGCRYVVHVASPMGQGASRGTDLVGPARDGTLRVLRAAAAAGVERVVCTSSGLAARTPTVPGERQPLADENTWTDPAEPGLDEYARSKVLAERAAWDFIRGDKSGMTLTTVLPGLIVGAAMTRHVSPSLELVARFITGKVPAIPHVGFSITDVHDLVDLHIRAMSHPAAANQRLIAAGDFLWFADIAQALREAFPDRAHAIPKRRLPDWIMRASALFSAEARFMVPLLGKRREFDTGRTAQLLQWRPAPSRDAVIRCARSLVENGIV
ncbi:nucleoside-diphosphate-sugar epimerase [Pseudoduganella flava]|uniref:Nucleoside-diphosphate-sugar epimerase n=1 Tax=Pseudoduganella flava TaxID=871742 RepID=A0A562PHB1_9BURK|nr:NAD-dependent epimerase/dehydratase family protein [Pseudoduganella flava]TWI43723.1 nucleoside-diphosphate-sugar epimerase [Pseudoduganella flava]